MKVLKKKEWLIITLVFIVLVSIISVLAYYNFFVGPTIVNVEKIDSIRFENKKIFNIEVSNSPLKYNKATWCLLVEKDSAVDFTNSEWEKASNNYCSIIADDKDYDIYIKDSYDNYDSTKEGFKKIRKKKFKRRVLRLM